MNNRTTKAASSLFDFVPEQTYSIQSGKHKGKHPTQMLFSEPSSLMELYRMNQQKSVDNVFSRYLTWLYKRGRQLETKVVCLYCKERGAEKKRKVENFSYLSCSGVSIGLEYTLCDHFLCEHKVRNECGYEGSPEILPFNFETLARFNGHDLETVLKLYNKVFEFPFNPNGTPNPEKILDFLKK